MLAKRRQLPIMKKLEPEEENKDAVVDADGDSAMIDTSAQKQQDSDDDAEYLSAKDELDDGKDSAESRLKNERSRNYVHLTDQSSIY